MTPYGGIFYALSAIIVISTAMAITRRNSVHAVIYLVISFFTTGLLFYMLGAPFPAVMEVIIYAGGIMVLFLFIIMMMQLEQLRSVAAGRGQWIFPVVLAVVSLAAGAVMIVRDPANGLKLKAAMASPMSFGYHLMKEYWFPVEVVSYLLFVGLVGAYYLGKQEDKRSSTTDRDGDKT